MTGGDQNKERPPTVPEQIGITKISCSGLVRRTEPFSLKEWVNDNEELCSKIDKDMVEGALLAGKKIRFEIAKERHRAKALLKLGPIANDDPRLFTYVDDFKIRVAGENDGELTMKKFFALMHRFNYTSGYGVQSALCMNATFPKACTDWLALVGDGVELNHDLVAAKPVLLCFVLTLEYLGFVSNKKYKGKRHIGKTAWLRKHADTSYGMLSYMRQISSVEDARCDVADRQAGVNLFLKVIINAGSRGSIRVQEFMWSTEMYKTYDATKKD